MPQDKDFYQKVAEARDRNIAFVAGFNLPVPAGSDLYGAAWELIFMARRNEPIPELPAELRARLVADAISYGEGLYERDRLEEAPDIELLEAYTDAAASYAQFSDVIPWKEKDYLTREKKKLP